MIQSKEYTGSVKKKKKMENAMALIAIVKLPQSGLVQRPRQAEVAAII
jgi:hypothetical protein